MDFVVGMRVHKSNNHPTEDICDVLADDYPKDFNFSAWHPQCRCYVTSILCTKEEMIRMQKNILSGNDAANAGFHSVNEVRTVPKAFKDWVENNQERIVRAKALPYFLKDNGKVVDGKWILGGVPDIKVKHKFGSSSLYETKESKRKTEEAITKSENNKPLTFSKRQIQNHKELEEAIGVKQGEQMTIPEADYGKGNAYHGTDALYDENCTLVSFAYELRRRGFPVTAFKAAEGSLAWDVGDDYKLAWEKPRTVTLDGNKRAILPKVLDSHTHKEGRYHLFMDMKVGYSHTIIAERLKDGTLVFLDEQDNSKWSISFLQNVANLEIFKVDELCINPSVAKELVQPYYGEKIKKKKR